MSNDGACQAFSSHNCEIAMELHSVCNLVQFFGVTATLFAFLSFIQNNELDYLRCAWIPICFAYFSLINHLLLNHKYSKKPIVLLWACWGIFFLDVLYLGALVGMTGGTSNSLFTPLFLLIPSAASCFCHPKGKPFLWLIITILCVYTLVSFCYWDNNKFCFWGANIAMTKGKVSEILPKVEEGEKGEILTYFFTVSCIATAAFCYYKTGSIRLKMCKILTIDKECKNRALQ